MFLRHTLQKKQGFNWPNSVAGGSTYGHGTPLLAETISLVARMSSAPDSTRQNHINILISSLKTAGSWNKMDLLYILAAHDSQAAKLNWKSGSFDLTEINSPTFTTDRGYTGNGTDMELDTGFTPSTHASQLQQNSAHIGAFALTAGAGTATFDFGAATGTLLGVRARTGTGGGARVQDGGTLAASSGGSLPVHIMGIRRDGSTRKVFRSGVEVNSANASSSGLGSTSVSILKGISLYSDRQVAVCHLGGQLSDGEALATYNALLTYLQAVGAAS